MVQTSMEPGMRNICKKDLATVFSITSFTKYCAL